MDVGNLLLQINQLEEVIKMYKSVLMQMKHKYHEMESKLKEKAMNDHFIDVLKLQIEDLQVKQS
jgi:predicted RNase H-like nuclease (RuvC/YqgF family)